MIFQNKPLTMLVAALMSTCFLAGCGGAPGVDDGSNDGGIDQDVLVDLSRVPTTISIALDDPGDTYTTNGVELSVSAIAGNDVGEKSFDGLVVQFVADEMGVFQDDNATCMIEGVGCDVTWVSAGIRPEAQVVVDGDGNPVLDDNGDVQYVSMLNLLVMLDGAAEPWDDVNGNELYDEGESFTDIGEPFADVNENGVFDLNDGDDADENGGLPAEYFKDVNNDGEYTSEGNGKWDGPCSMTSMACSEDSSIILFQNGSWDIYVAE